MYMLGAQDKGGTPMQFGWGCTTGFVKVPPFTRANFANFVTLYQSTLSIFCYYNFCLLSDPTKQDPNLDQFSMINRPYPRVNGLKTIPFPAAHTRIANIFCNFCDICYFCSLHCICNICNICNCMHFWTYLNN